MMTNIHVISKAIQARMSQWGDNEKKVLIFPISELACEWGNPFSPLFSFPPLPHFFPQQSFTCLPSTIVFSRENSMVGENEKKGKWFSPFLFFLSFAGFPKNFCGRKTKLAWVLRSELKTEKE